MIRDFVKAAQKGLRSVLVVVLISSAMVLSGCSTNPATGEKHLNLVSQAQEIQMGKQANEEVAATMGFYPDKELQAYVESIGKRLAATSERPDLPWKFQVVDDPVVNAFAIPGGFIYITRGILAHLSNEAELAGVMGHEIGHVTAKHSINRMATQQLAQLGLGIGMILKPDWAEKYGQLAGLGLNLLFLKFSRDDESQADHLGLRYMERINEDPRQMAQVMAMLGEVSKESGNGALPEWLSTHPDPGNRKEAIEEEIKGVQGGFAHAAVNQDLYLSKLDGLTFGEDPREGYFKGTTFYHPQMKFRMDFPAGWKTQNGKQAVVAVSGSQDAALQLSGAPGRSIDEAAQAFFSQQGVTATSTRTGSIHGFRVITGDFAAQTDQGNIQGNVTFMAFDTTLFQLLGYSAPENWTRYASEIQNTVSSFDRLTDPAALNVKPMKLKIVTLPRAMTVSQLASAYSSALPLERLALLNQVDSTGTLPAGHKAKVVVR